MDVKEMLAQLAIIGANLLDRGEDETERTLFRLASAHIGEAWNRLHQIEENRKQPRPS